MSQVYKTTKTYDNWFATTLTVALASSGSGDYNVYLEDEPTDDEVYLVLEPDATNKREIIRCWKTASAWAGYMLTNDAGNRGLSGGNSAVAHLAGTSVEMRNVAQIFAKNDEFIEPTKGAFVEAEDTTGLILKIYPFFGEIGGTRVAYNGTTHFEGTSPVDGTSFTGTDAQSVTDASTNYIELDSAGAIQISTSAWSSLTSRKRLAIVVTSGGNISSVVDSRTFGDKPGAGVSTIAEEGGTQVSGDIEFAEGSNISISRAAKVFTISAVTTGTTSTMIRETPTGTVNGVNASFTVTHAPASSAAILVWINGINVPYGSGAGKFTISATTITFGTAPATSSVLEVQITY